MWVSTALGGWMVRGIGDVSESDRRTMRVHVGMWEQERGRIRNASALII